MKESKVSVYWLVLAVLGKYNTQKKVSSEKKLTFQQRLSVVVFSLSPINSASFKGINNIHEEEGSKSTLRIMLEKKLRYSYWYMELTRSK